MNACPKDGVLLQFLDAELKAEEAAWVLAHVEDCAGCQERLERFTEGRPVPGDRPPIETVHTDPDSTADLNSTALLDREPLVSGEHGASLREDTAESVSGAAQVSARV